MIRWVMLHRIGSPMHPLGVDLMPLPAYPHRYSPIPVARTGRRADYSCSSPLHHTVAENAIGNAARETVGEWVWSQDDSLVDESAFAAKSPVRA